jgi:hypothetical protein
MSHLFIASAMGAMAYVFVVPVLICSVLAGILLSVDGAKTWANIHGGVLLLYAVFEVRTRSADSSFQRISTTTDIMAVAAVALACFFAWRSSKPTPAEGTENTVEVERPVGTSDFMFAVAIQVVTAAVIYLLLGLTLVWL